jgi:hypothetical protein
VGDSLRDSAPQGRGAVTPARLSPRDRRSRRRAARARVRVALFLALVLAAAALVFELSGSAPRLSGTDHVSLHGFLAPVPGGRELCQSQMLLPQHTRKLRLLLSTRGRHVPELVARFLSAQGSELAGGRLRGAHKGWVFIPLSPELSSAAAGTLCIRNAGQRRVLLAGEPFTPASGSARVAGAPVAARIDVAYFRPGSESWWQLLPTLSERFGYGKAPLFGDWALAVLALALIGLWVATARLLMRELT